MSEVSKETGVIAVLAKRMVEERLPRALAMKERVNRGEVLNDLDMAFLEQIVEEAGKVGAVIRSDPRILEVAGSMLQLYKEITAKALENESARKS